MRLLLIHSKPFSYKCEAPTRFAEDPSEAAPAEARVDDALAALFAIEKPDELTPDRSAGKAALEIEKAYTSAGAKKIVLYPYPQLSTNLCSPDVELAVIRKLRDALAHLPIVCCPFGWQRSFTISGRGKTSGGLGRVIEFEPSDITRSVDRGREHPIAKVAESLRQALLEAGFDETIAPAVLDEPAFRKLYGPQADTAMDRAWRLAETERPAMPLDDKRKQTISELAPDFKSFPDLGRAMRRFAEDQIGVEQLLAETAALMKISPDKAASLAEKIYPELSQAGVVPAAQILRSDIAPAWMPALRRAARRMTLPVKLFASGPRYRNEREPHPFRAQESSSVSFAVMEKNITLDGGKKIVVDLLKKIGLENVSYRRRKTNRGYFESDSDTGVYIPYGEEHIKIGGIGFLSQETLEEHNISGVKVFFADFGVERLAVILAGGDDIGGLAWPPPAETIAIDDPELGSLLGPVKSPLSPELKIAAPKMAALAVDHRDDIGPAEITLFTGSVADREVIISVFNWDEGRPLLSLAATNTIYTRLGNIYGLPADSSALGDKYAEVYNSGSNTGLRFIDLIIEGFLAEAEDRAGNPRPGAIERKWKIAKHADDINLNITPDALDYIRRTRKTIKIGGPLFFGLRAVFK